MSQIRLYIVSPGDGVSLKERILQGHDFLVSITGKDYGYDLVAWHNYLKESRQGGYTFARINVLPRVMKAALESSEWQAAVRGLS